jgi:hypothetical protein
MNRQRRHKAQDESREYTEHRGLSGAHANGL